MKTLNLAQYALAIGFLCLVWLWNGAPVAKGADTAKQIERRIDKSRSALRFFDNHRWLHAPRHDRCTTIPWTRSCLIARERVRYHTRRLEWLNRRLDNTIGPTGIICQVFGSYCSQAVAVSSCETGGTFHTGAQNGQYLGLFQMGDYARSRYGHGWDARTQARAAYRYFADSGYDWSPWSCKP